MRNAFPKRAFIIAGFLLPGVLRPSFLFLNAQSQPNAQAKERQLGAQEPLRTASASRVEVAPKLDGTLADPTWQQATPIGTFLQREPFEGQTPTEKTEVRILYGTFEAIVEDYSISDVTVQRLALIVRAADIKGQEGVAPEGVGLRSIAQGFAATGLLEDRLARQFPVYDALYAFVQSKQV